jgi:hypothetical protein
MDLCPQCHRKLPSDKRFCLDCGLLVRTEDQQLLQPPLPELSGVRLRIISCSGRACIIVPKHRTTARGQQLGRPRRRKSDKPFCVWPDLGIPLVALIFVFSLMLALAEALQASGLSPIGLGLIALPLGGAIGAERIWLAGHWRAGLLGMFLSEGILWAIAASFAFWPLL